MNRKIIFRGKRLDNGEWVYGDLIHIDDSDIGIVTDYDHWQGCRVDPETVGLFTGLFDKNGKDIYEGDILRSPLGHVVIIKFGYKEHIAKHDIFTDCFAAYGWIVENIKNGITDFLDNEFLQGEVIGNIHDNPEMLKGGQDGEN